MKRKALIMANVGATHFHNGEVLPSCFLQLYNKMTIVNRQISLLNVNGFSKDDICVVCGSEGVWQTDSVKSKVSALEAKIIFESRNNMLDDEVLSDPFFDDCDLIYLEGNHIVDIAIISRLKRYNQRDALVVTEALDPDDVKRLISLDGDRVVSIRSYDLADYPWVVFTGIAKLSLDTVGKLRSALKCSRPFLDVLEDILPSSDIKAIRYDDLVYGMLNGGHSDELTGGSYSKLNYRLVVKKESDENGREKLINEVEWLLSLPTELKPYFSEVLEYDIQSPHVYYNVPYYGSRNLREHIFDGHLDADAACSFLENLLDWMFSNVYSRKIGDTPSDWVMEKHIRRVLDRLPECASKCPEFGKLIGAEEIVINGRKYRNVRELYTKLSNNKDFLERVKPKDMVMIHGDLHFQNILLSNETDAGFILVDPRGERKGSDIYYDLGKIWHSFHAKYDFIHSDQFRFNLRWDGELPLAEYEITNKFVELVYDEIYQKFQKTILKYPAVLDDPDWEMKILFAEASHLCSVSTFHIGKTESYDRPITLYLIGVVLINEFCSKYLQE